ncbi:MAG: hypothetical protein EBR02_02745 [Alphaproteobacteria bacterium]|nr:hypothetical protein [Alphaproteobacteria bacterium]
MRILLTNDDGITAEGLKTLEGIARELSDDVWIVAPETEQSGAGHSLTLHLPVRVRKVSEKTYAVSGTPTDCVLLALKEIIPNSLSLWERVGVRADGEKALTQAVAAPLPRGEGAHGVDLVLSGVNRGSNAGDDVTYSGTVAGVSA